MNEPVDLRSDTVTLPTPAMYERMASAPLGDDGLDGDPTAQALEQAMAQKNGLKRGEYYVFYGLVAPARTPGAVVASWNQAVNQLLRTKPVQDALAERGIDSRPMSANDFGRFLDAERAKWGAIVKASGATAD